MSSAPLARLTAELERLVAQGAEPDLEALAEAHGLPVSEVRGIARGLAAVQDALAEPAAAAALAPPDLPDDLELEGELGRGGMGVVYRARQRSLDREVAVKVLRPGELVFGEALARFQREARALAKLRHPHIVSIHEVGESGGHVYYVMDLFEESLADLLASKQRPMPVARVTRLLEQVASAVAFVHAHGLVHRDLKPANVLLDATGDAYVADFGLVVDPSEGATLTATGNLLGTPDFMAPEQALGDRARVDERTDVYALGVILYQCLTGTTPFAGRALVDKIHAVAHEEPPRPRKLVADVPREIELVCNKAMAKDPDERYPTAAAFAEDLRRFLDGRPVEARPPTLARRGAALARRHGRAAAIAVIGAVFALAVTAPWKDPSGAEDLADAEMLWERGEKAAAQVFFEKAVTRLQDEPEDVRLRSLLGHATSSMAVIDELAAAKDRDATAAALGRTLDALARSKEDLEPEEQLRVAALELTAARYLDRDPVLDAFEVVRPGIPGGLDEDSTRRFTAALDRLAQDCGRPSWPAASELALAANLRGVDDHDSDLVARRLARADSVVPLEEVLGTLLGDAKTLGETRSRRIRSATRNLGWLSLDGERRRSLSDRLASVAADEELDGDTRSAALTGLVLLNDLPLVPSFTFDRPVHDAALALWVAVRDLGRVERERVAARALIDLLPHANELDRAKHWQTRGAIDRWLFQRGLTDLGVEPSPDRVAAWLDGCGDDFPIGVIARALEREVDPRDPRALVDELVATPSEDGHRLRRLHLLLWLSSADEVAVPAWPTLDQFTGWPGHVVGGWLALHVPEDRAFALRIGIGLQEHALGAVRWVDDRVSTLRVGEPAIHRVQLDLEPTPVRVRGLLEAGRRTPTTPLGRVELEVSGDLLFEGRGVRTELGIDIETDTGQSKRIDTRSGGPAWLVPGRAAVVWDGTVTYPHSSPGVRKIHRVLIVASMAGPDAGVDPGRPWPERLRAQVLADVEGTFASSERQRFLGAVDAKTLLATSLFPHEELAEPLLRLPVLDPKGTSSEEVDALLVAQLASAGERAFPLFPEGRVRLQETHLRWPEAAALCDSPDPAIRRFVSESVGPHPTTTADQRRSLSEAWGNDAGPAWLTAEDPTHDVTTPLHTILASITALALAAAAFGLARFGGWVGVLVAWIGLALVTREVRGELGLRTEVPGLALWAGLTFRLARDARALPWTASLVLAALVLAIAHDSTRSEALRAAGGATLVLAAASTFTLTTRWRWWAALGGLVVLAFAPAAAVQVTDLLESYEWSARLRETIESLEPAGAWAAFFLPLTFAWSRAVKGAGRPPAAR